MSYHLLSRQQGEHVWLVDASIYVFRAWFVRGDIPYDTKHQPVNAVKGFLRFVYMLLHEQQPNQVAFAFDISLQSSLRKDIYPEYKANREAAPAELKYQFQLCRDFIDALGIVQYASPHHEADDVIGTWASQQRQQEQQVIIISGDKDLAQLVHGDELWWDYNKRKALNDGGIKSTFGVWPQQIADQLAIAGDKADNIPGVPGVGMATAAKLLKRFGNLENLLANQEKIEKMQIRGAKRLSGLIAEHQDTVRLAKKLTLINCEVPDLPTDLKRQPKDIQRLHTLCKQLGLSEQQYQQWLEI